MAKKKGTTQEGASKNDIGNITVSDVMEALYKPEGNEAALDLRATHYSNLAYVQVTERDVYIDFIEMPGIKKDGRIVVSASRIYMSHVAGKRLGDALIGVLNKAQSDGRLETIKTPKKPPVIRPDKKVKKKPSQRLTKTQ